MVDLDQQGQGEPKAERAPEAADLRRPYEAPRLMKKRSVAQATLFTVQTVSSVGLVTMG
ncbi:MAG: hypothetical protein U0359_33595 [Byssovorax sp.]